MQYPVASDPDQVGQYDEAAYTGGGRFFDEVLEYRVWCYLDNEAKASNYSDDDEAATYQAFAIYEQALAFANNTDNAEPPVVLVRQLEWVDQPSKGVFIHNKSERITEWNPEWLSRGVRKSDDIAQFLQKHATAK